MSGREPAIGFADARAWCVVVHPSRHEALAVRLRTAGWRVPLLGSAAPGSAGLGTGVLATVFHPSTGASPGTLTYHTTGTDPPAHLMMWGDPSGDDVASLVETAELLTRLDGPLAGQIADVILWWLTSTLLADLTRRHDGRVHRAVTALALRAAENDTPHTRQLYQVALHHAAATGHQDEVAIVLQAAADHLVDQGERLEAAELIELAAAIAAAAGNSRLAASLARRHAQLRRPDGPAVSP